MEIWATNTWVHRKFTITMPDESAITSPGAVDDQALLMGKIRPPEGLLSALRKIRHGAYQQHAVLLIFSKDIKGRLGVSGNRIITGATLEPSSATGLVAANQILAVSHGMYGFRAALGNEKEELAQNLDIDIDTLLNRAGLGTAAGADGDTDTTLDRAFPAIPTGDVATEDNEVDKSYLEWLRSEKDKVFADIERSMDRARNAPMPASAEDIVAASKAQEAENDLRLVSEMLQSEQHRAAQGWQGLDDIPTPSSVNPVAAAQQVERRSGASSGPASRKISTAAAMKTSGRYRAPNMASSEYPAAQAETDASRDQKLRTELADYSRRRQIRIGIAVVAVVFACGYMNFWMTSKDVDRCFAEAKTLFAKKDYKGTIFLMQQALTKDANNPRLHMQKGLAHARLGESDNAIKEFDAALKAGGPRLPALVARATVFCDKEEFDKAIAECQAILLHYPKSVETYSILATAYERQSQQQQAVKAATDGLAVATDPAAKARLLLQRGFSYGRMQQPEKAEADLTEAIKLKETPAMYMARGDIYKKLRKYPEAVVDYSLVIKAQPDNYNAYVARGIAEMKAGRDEEAITDFAHALCINKSGVEAMIQRGSLYLSRGAYQLAINDLSDAVRLNPRIAESQQKLDAAQKHLRTSTPHLVLKLDEAKATKFKMPSDPQEIMKVGRKFLDDGEIDHAVLCFKAVVKKQPNNAEGRRLLAQTLYEGGDSAGAASQFEALNSLAGIDPNDVLPMAQSLARSGRRDRAIQVLETWVGVAPRVVPFRYELANLHFANHNAAKAKEVILAGMRTANSDDRNKLQSLLSSIQAPVAGKRNCGAIEKHAGME